MSKYRHGEPGHVKDQGALLGRNRWPRQQAFNHEQRRNDARNAILARLNGKIQEVTADLEACGMDFSLGEPAPAAAPAPAPARPAEPAPEPNRTARPVGEPRVLADSAAAAATAPRSSGPDFEDLPNR